MRAWMPMGRLARRLGVPRAVLADALAGERMIDRSGHPTARAVDWGYARLSTVSAVSATGSDIPVPRWHIRRCMRLVGREMPAGRDWDALLMAEEIEDVLDECARLEAACDTEALYRVLATLDPAVSAEVRWLLFDRPAVVLPLPQPRRAVGG